MLAFLFTLLVIAALCTSYYFTNKMTNQRKQILLLKYQNNNLKKSTKVKKSESLTIEYIFPNNSEGKIVKKCELFISPLSDSPVLNILEEDTPVQIHDSSKINNELWYEVSITSDKRVNSKGWIKEFNLYLYESSIQ